MRIAMHAGVDELIRLAELEALQALMDQGHAEADAGQLAPALVAIARLNDVPLQALLFWIHDRHPRKEWTTTAWASWAAKYAITAKAVESAKGSDDP
jgi:hypothetical protein